MRIDRSGIPFIVCSIVPAATLFVLDRPGWALVLGTLAAVFAFFFRAPDRWVPDVPHGVVSPADGRILYADAADPSAAPEGAWQQISIFLSPLDVHVNRIPIGGHVTRVSHKGGRFLPAYRQEAASENEQCEVWIEHQGQTIVFRQVVGLLARRVVCRLVPEMDVAVGERFGIMKFGSRMDIYLPLSAKLHASVGDVVRGGETVLATLVDSSALDS